ncbi:MAG TPA: c-type cytochrome domain-containing protein [Bacteroidia bacterium]|nr:c-type cytochrome domain-containing protein [Bacteroidia bacterium]
MIQKNRVIAFAFLIGSFFLFSECAYDKKEVIPVPVQKVDSTCYPDEIGKIFVGKCATSGCHNTKSKDAAAGLDLSTWDKLFNGSRGGAAIIPYNLENSFLVNFINTYDDLGPAQLPTMPNNGTPLTREEVITVINWIKDGAPDCSGNRFTDNADRRKFYITNQGCDLVSVWDADRQVIMKYVKVGGDPNLIESPHKVGISPDEKFWYVSFTGTNAKYFQKYRTSDDSFVGQLDIGFGSWNTFAFSPDSKTAYIPDYSTSNGRVAIVDCETMTFKSTPYPNPLPSGCPKPHGSFVSPDGHYLYLTEQDDNKIYKVDLINIFNSDALSNFPSGYTNPHEIAFSPDNTLYFVTCQGTNGNSGVLVYRVSDDQFLKKFDNVGGDPVEMAFSPSQSAPYLFVSCMTGNAVSIINYLDTTLVKTIDAPGIFYYPHGVAVDDSKGICYVINRNLKTAGGPPPHHTSVCDPNQNNGYLLAIDLNTLEIVQGFKPELSVDPYSIAIRK